ncbi:uncharacterized protein DS421_16g526830 [Arachis hypogaea]|nr:uncharacterized protein DS421_16g526830 [Arachis hypogaea]
MKPPCSRVADAREGNWLRLDRSSCGRMWRIGPWLDGLHVWPWIWVGRGASCLKGWHALQAHWNIN